MRLVCIKCPRGCELIVEGESISGNQCPKGVEYAKEEQIMPMRTVTALIKSNGNIVPVKTSRDVPKEKIKDVLKEISKIKAARTKIGDVVLSNVLGIGVDIVVTGNPYKE